MSRREVLYESRRPSVEAQLFDVALASASLLPVQQLFVVHMSDVSTSLVSLQGDVQAHAAFWSVSKYGCDT